jgi:hypothetical protein
LLTEYANSKGSFDMTDKRNIPVNASKIEQLMYDKHVATGGNPNISPEEHNRQRLKIAKYIPRFVEEQQRQLPQGQRQQQQPQQPQQLGQRQQQQQQHGIHSMGFPEADVKSALTQAKGNEQRAIEILISQQQRQQQQPQRQRPGIRSMGFDKDDVERALAQANGDEQRAIEILVHNLVTALLTDVRQNNKSWIKRHDVEVVVMNNLNKPNVYAESLAQLLDIPRPIEYIEQGADSELAIIFRDMNKFSTCN